MHIRWLIFFFQSVNMYPLTHFQGIGLGGIIVITQSNADSASPRKIALLIFTLAKIFPPTVNSTLQFSIVISVNFMSLSDIFYILKQFVIQFCVTIMYAFCCHSTLKLRFAVSFCSP